MAKPRLYTVVVNESSGGGRAGRQLPKVVRYLHEHLPTADLHIVRSESFEEAESACRAAADACREGDAVIVMGGDGMAHLGLNACANRDATLGIIPAGTGNDFARGVGLPKSIAESVAAIARGRTGVLDLSRISNETFAERYVGAIVSTGYDARVNKATNDINLRFGPLSYGYIALRELKSFSPLQYQLRIDGQERNQEAMLVAVCNTGVFGGGMKIAPDADPTDGLLDVTIVHPTSRGTLLKLLPRMYSGKFTHPAIERLQATEVEIDGDELFVMGDGEELGTVPVTITSQPRALRIFVD
nr:YegS/Rv2252/BmrU family lipid kinase [Tessaracoccus sp. OS52]